MPGRLGLIVNPTSGRNTGALIGTEALTLLRGAGVDIVDLSAADARGALEKGRAAIAAGSIDSLVVAGGDGMVHLGANLRSEERRVGKEGRSRGAPLRDKKKGR